MIYLHCFMWKDFLKESSASKPQQIVIVPFLYKIYKNSGSFKHDYFSKQNILFSAVLHGETCYHDQFGLLGY